MTTQTLFTSQIPALPDVADNTITVGTTFTVAVAGNIVGLRWYAPTNAPGIPTGALWDINGNLLASAPFGALVLGTWNTVTFASPVPVSPGQFYVVGVGPVTRYTATNNFFLTALTNGDLTGPADAAPVEPLNGRFTANAALTFPTSTSGHNSYFVDPMFDAGQSIVPASLTSTVTFGAPTVAWSGSIVPDSITAHVTFGTPTVDQQSPLGYDPFKAVGQTMLECLCNAVALEGAEAPMNCCFRVGLNVAHDLGLREDLCCEGLAYVALGDVHPSTDSFPELDIIRQANQVCGISAWAAEFKIGIIRCVPVGDEFSGPSCTEWTAAAERNFLDSQALRRAMCCFTEKVRFDGTYLNGLLLGMSVVVNPQTQGEPQGGCVERYATIQVQIPNCETC